MLIAAPPSFYNNIRSDTSARRPAFDRLPLFAIGPTSSLFRIPPFLSCGAMFNFLGCTLVLLRPSISTAACPFILFQYSVCYSSDFRYFVSSIALDAPHLDFIFRMVDALSYTLVLLQPSISMAPPPSSHVNLLILVQSSIPCLLTSDPVSLFHCVFMSPIALIPVRTSI
jgi:hypothetical protein